MSYKYFLKEYLPVLIVWFSCVIQSISALGSESDLREIVRKHDDMWKQINSIQVSYTRVGKFGGIASALSGCRWESDGNRSKATIIYLDNFSKDKSGKPTAVEMCKDFFDDGKMLYELKTLRDEYPTTEVGLCDYASWRNEGCEASIFAGDVFDIRFNFPIPRYFLVHTEKRCLTLLELVNKYPSRVVSSTKSPSGDNLVEIAIEGEIDTHESFGPWKETVFINTSKGYNIEVRRSSMPTKDKPSVDIISEFTVKKYAEIEGYWLPSIIEIGLHNGEPEKGIRTSFIVDDCKINDLSESRLDDFRFPTNCVVHGQLSNDQSGIIHIWGPDNKPARSFDEMLKFLEYYTNECMSSGELPQENKYLAFRISLVIIGLVMIIVALYRLHAKES